MAAFDAALRRGTHGIETDLRLSRDGKVVLIHDRIVADSHPVADLTHEELSSCLQHAVPLLDDVLSTYPSTLWNLEIKAPEVVPCLLKTLRRYPAANRLLLTSFWHNTVFAVAAETDVPCGLLISHRPAGVSALIPPDAPSICALVCFCDTMDEAIIAEAAGRNVDTYIYSPVTRADHDRIRDSGAVGVITDFPELTGIAS